ncbi:MAG: hypothetical protein ABI140_18215 [Jatrophihabitantaceae bacterium]
MSRSSCFDPMEPTALEGPAGNRRLITGRGLRLLAPLLLGVTICLLAGWFELTRALGGREVAWVYVVEWPLFAVIGVYMWWRLLDPTLPGAAPIAVDRAITGQSGAGADDPELRAWQAYLAELQASDPPGGPPPRRADESVPAGWQQRRHRDRHEQQRQVADRGVEDAH